MDRNRGVKTPDYDRSYAWAPCWSAGPRNIHVEEEADSGVNAGPARSLTTASRRDGESPRRLQSRYSESTEEQSQSTIQE